MKEGRATSVRIRALVTGASRGIGRAIAIALAAPGRDLIINYLQNTEGAESTRSEVVARGASATLCKFDVADYTSCRCALRTLWREDDPVNVIVLNAGIVRDALLGMMSLEEWVNVISTNLNSFFNVVRPLVRGMIGLGWGRIVAISSVSGQDGCPGQANYSASKAGVIGAVKALAGELVRYNITVNAISPGPIATDMYTGAGTKRIRSGLHAKHVRPPEDVASVVAMLCSTNAQCITGQVIGVGDLCRNT